MPIPVLLVAGFLGAGKTSLIRNLLTEAHGQRLAAIVNDFGAINIDAELLADGANGVVSLKNGCICCSLQGDLLRTIAILLRQRPEPDAIVIETSGVSDPKEIVANLLDPVIWKAAPLDTVVSVVDAGRLHSEPDLWKDTLFQAQLAAGDFLVLNKTDQVDAATLETVLAQLKALNPRRQILQAEQGRVPIDLLLSNTMHQAAATPRLRLQSDPAPRFASIAWTADRPLSMPKFQAAIGKLIPGLVRAKGFVVFEHDPARRLVFQLVGSRATMSVTESDAGAASLIRLVFIVETNYPEENLRNALADCLAEPDPG